MIINCAVSVASAVLVPVFPGWLLTPVGLAVGAIWNLLIVVLMVLVILEFKSTVVPGKSFESNLA